MITPLTTLVPALISIVAFIASLSINSSTKTEHGFKNGLSPNRENCETDSFDESIKSFESDRADLEKFSDLRNSSERKRKKQKKRKSERSSSPQQTCLLQAKDSQYVASLGQNPRRVSQNATRFECILEQEELRFCEHFNGESEDLTGRVQFPTIVACSNAMKQGKRSDYEWKTKATSSLEEISLPALTGKRLPPERKNAVSRLPLLKSSSSLPLLRNLGSVSMVHGFDCKLVGPVEPVVQSSPKLTNYPEGLTRADRSEINSIHLLAN